VLENSGVKITLISPVLSLLTIVKYREARAAKQAEMIIEQK
jgi:hypothetical protein